MVFALAGSWYVGNTDVSVRKVGFVYFLISNCLWITFAAMTLQWPLFFMNMAFIVTSVRGYYNGKG